MLMFLEIKAAEIRRENPAAHSYLLMIQFCFLLLK